MGRRCSMWLIPTVMLQNRKCDSQREREDDEIRSFDDSDKMFCRRDNVTWHNIHLRIHKIGQRFQISSQIQSARKYRLSFSRYFNQESHIMR